MDGPEHGTGVYILPVLQGFAPEDYVRHIAMYGLRLLPGQWVGVRSVCKRNGEAGSMSPRHTDLLIWVLWKLQATQPLTITLEDVQACRRAFWPDLPTMLILGPGHSVEVRVRSHADARMRRVYDDSQMGEA